MPDNSLQVEFMRQQRQDINHSSALSRSPRVRCSTFSQTADIGDTQAVHIVTAAVSTWLLKRATGFNCSVYMYKVVVTARRESSCSMPRSDILNAIILAFFCSCTVDNNLIDMSHNNKV